MMHGYLAFDENDTLLVPFRTWRNTITGEAAAKLSALFNYNIPQRWSIAHLYQAILNGEEHVDRVRFITTLAGYVHWKLTGQKVIGNGDASGMFPIDPATKDYNARMIGQFEELVAEEGFSWKLRHILPKSLLAGEDAGTLTEEGAKLLDPSGNLESGNPHVSARRRRRNRNGSDKQCGGPHRKRVCGNQCICHGGTGKGTDETV